MKKKLVFLVIAIFTLGLLISGCGKKEQATDNSWKEIQQKGKFVLGLDDSFPPMGFKDDKGQIIGFDIDMAQKQQREWV